MGYVKCSEEDQIEILYYLGKMGGIQKKNKEMPWDMERVGEEEDGEEMESWWNWISKKRQ